MHKRFLSILFLFIASSEAHAVTLDEVIDAVRATHPAIRRAEWEARSAKARRGTAWLPDPKVGVEFEEILKSDFSFDNAEMTNYSVSQEIPFPATILSQSQAAGAEYRARQSLVTSSEREEVFRAKKTYFELVSVTNKINEKTTVLNHLGEISSSFETGFLAGREAYVSLAMFKMKKGEIEAELFDLQHLQKAGQSELNLLMGKPPHAPLAIESVPPIRKLNVSAEELERRLFAQNSDLSAFRWMTKKAKKEAGTARLGLVPTVEPEFMYNQRKNREDAYTLKLSMNVPLWLNRNTAEIRGARAAYRRAQAEYDQEGLRAKTDLHDLFHHATEHYKIIAKYRNDILPVARQGMKTALASFGTGRVNTAEVWIAADQYQSAIQEYWDAWNDYQTEYAFLERMLGEEL